MPTARFSDIVAFAGNNNTNSSSGISCSVIKEDLHVKHISSLGLLSMLMFGTQSMVTGRCKQGSTHQLFCTLLQLNSPQRQCQGQVAFSIGQLEVDCIRLVQRLGGQDVFQHLYQSHRSFVGGRLICYARENHNTKQAVGMGNKQ